MTNEVKKSNEIQLSSSVVTIKENLTWGDTEKIQAALIKGAKMETKEDSGKGELQVDPSAMFEIKYVTLECSVVVIKEQGKEKEFTRDWMYNLSKEDGDKLYSAVDELSKKGKRTTSN